MGDYNEDTYFKDLLESLTSPTDLSKELEEEIKGELQMENRKIVGSFSQHSRQIVSLENRFDHLLKRIGFLERLVRKNNVVIHGLIIPADTPFKDYVLQKIGELVGIDIPHSAVNNVVRLPGREIPSIKLEFTSFMLKQNLLDHCFKLRGSRISVVHDLCKADREDQKILRAFKREARSYNISAVIRNKCLITHNRIYTPDELKNIDMALFRSDLGIIGDHVSPSCAGLVTSSSSGKGTARVSAKANSTSYKLW